MTENLPYDRIEDAAVPLRIIATDFEDGSPVVLDAGSVVDAVMASTCLPGIFLPQRIGDHLYRDGVLSDPVPLKPAVDAGADALYVLAVSTASAPPSVGAALWGMSAQDDLMDRSHQEAAKFLADRGAVRCR